MRKITLVAPLALLFVSCSTTPQVATVEANDPLIDGFRKVAIASVSDAVDQVTGERGFLSHDVRPRTIGNHIPDKIVGRARTAILKKTTADKASAELSAKHSVEMIDQAQAGEIGVIVVEGTLDVAGLGGLMATAAKARNMEGLIVDGAVRDVSEMRGLGLPVYSRSVAPSSSVGRWASESNQQPVDFNGVIIRPGDILIAGEDGAVRVPADRAEEVLKRAQEIDERETQMVPFIQKEKSLTKAVQEFKRI